MANVDFDMTVQQTVINVTDQTGETFEVTPQPKVEVSIAEGYEAETLTQGISYLASKVEEEADSIEAKIEEIVTAYNNGQETIDQMVAIQLQTIIGDGD